MNFGDIVHLNWSPQAGHEMMGPHYGVILSTKEFNDNFPMVVVAPITSKYHDEFEALRPEVQASPSGIKGYVCLDLLRSIDPEARNFKISNKKLNPACKATCRGLLKKILPL
jgi:mRNA interferase MazF